MSWGRIAYLYLVTIPIFLVLDFIWLGLVARGFYQSQLEGLFAERVNWGAAFIFYLLFVAGILIFAVLPAVERESWSYALVYGALFGLFTYSTYDLTNLATLKGWPLPLVMVDIAWGVFLSGSVAWASYAVARWLG
ncbi:MAG: DUF2177 family protein [Deltaproteobacteria bacterium]|nr:DUF2177 family protein [Deltaproteobacteria bacterium]